MERRRFLVSSLGGVFVSLAAGAQQASARVRVAVFFAGFPQSYGSERTWGPTFVSALRDLGWVDGHNLTLEWRYSEDQEERRRALAEDFVRRKLDVIVVQSTSETVEMKRVSATIPIVMVLIGDPVGAGLAQGLARPGGNITGTSLMTSETSTKGLEFLKELLPTAHRVTVLGNPGNASVVRNWMETRDVARRLGVELLSAEVRSRDELPAVFAAILQERPDALTLTVDTRHQIAEFAAKNTLPALYSGPMFAEAAGFWSTRWTFMSCGGAPRFMWTEF